MKTNMIVSGLLAVIGSTVDIPLLADESVGTGRVRSSAQASERGVEQPAIAQSVKSKRRERVRYIYPPTKR
jgi:hypothetical protein